MKDVRWRNPFAFGLLLMLLVPILAACGGTTAPAGQTAVPAATAGGATGAATTAATSAAPAETAPVATMTEATTTTGTEATAGTAETAAAGATETAAAGATETATSGAAAPGVTSAANAATVIGGGGTGVSPAGNILRVNFGSEPDTTDPQKASFVGEIEYIMLNYLPLMTFDTTLKPVPGAAQSVNVSQDGKTFTFKLRPNQKYSDGEPLDAKNFEYAFKRECDPAVAGEYQSIVYPIVGCQEYAEAFSTAGLTKTDVSKLQSLRNAVAAKALDANTFEVKLKEPAPYFLNVFALWVGAPIRQDLVEKGGENWWSDPANYIGNGPFQLTEWNHQSDSRWVRNENFAMADRKPKFEAIEAKQITDSSVAFQAYRNGELDIGGVAAEDLGTVQSDPELKSQFSQTAGSCNFYLGFNTKKPPFDKKEVRQAFATAFDREAYIRDILKGLGKPALSFIPPGFPGNDPNETRFKFDKAAAAQLLDKAGVNKSQEIKLTYASSARNKTRFEYIAAMFQNNLGVKIGLDPVDPTAYTALLKKSTPVEKAPAFFLLGWCADYPDPQDWLSLVFQTGGSASDRANWSNKQFDELTKKADALPVDSPDRAKLYQDAQKLLVEEAPVAFLYYDVTNILVKPWVKNIHLTPLDYFPGIFDLGSIEVTTQ